MSIPKLAQLIASEDLHAGASNETLLQSIDLFSHHHNQLLFFFKPECFLLPGTARLQLVQFVLETLDKWQVEVSGTLSLTGAHLKAVGAMDRHYGSINHMSRFASEAIGGKLRESLCESLGVDRETPVFGGHELLDRTARLSPKSLLSLWSAGEVLKVQGGLYAQVARLEGQPVVLINGFHPEQLENFTATNRRIVLMVLNANLPWAILRGRVLGDTTPARARPGSVRRQLFERAREFGFESIGAGNNCCHMSAGPFEALFELHNFLTHSRVATYSFEDATLVRALRAASWKGSLPQLLSNPTLTPPTGERASLYDFTEDVDTDSAAYMIATLLKSADTASEKPHTE